MKLPNLTILGNYLVPIWFPGCLVEETTIGIKCRPLTRASLADFKPQKGCCAERPAGPLCLTQNIPATSQLRCRILPTVIYGEANIR